MQPNIKIFVSTHRPDVYFPDNKYLNPIQVGTTEDKCFDNILHDNEGDNIADKNSSYCELTAQYYAYKNIDADYYGFFHYRRYLNFSERLYPETIKPFICGDVLAKDNSSKFLERYCINEEQIKKVITSYDYIAPTMIDASDGLTIYEQYRDSIDHYISDLDSVLDIIKADYPDIWPYAKEYCEGYSSYLCNMFIMKKEIFKDYSSFLFDVLSKHEAICDMSNYSPIARRVSGYLGERLCGIYLTYLKAKGYKGKELQRVFFQEFRTQEAIAADNAWSSGKVSDKDNDEEEVDLASPVKSSYFDEGYEEWFFNNRVNPDVLREQMAKAFSINPKYSIIVPLYNTPLDFFDDMLESVLNQSYSNYELILINASPDNDELSAHIDDKINNNGSIKLITLERNLGITENTNYGIKEATGDFLCFFDHDDTLEADVLYEYTKALNENPNIDMFYCDEDKLQDGHYCNPFFKPNWNIDYLNAVNYVCHFLTVRKSILDEMELPTSDYDGSQDYHMTYRIGEKARAICHVPKVLYHWRIHSESTAGSVTQKDYTLDSSILSIEKHLERMNINARVRESDICPRRFSVRYDMPDEKVSVIIDYTGNIDGLNRCILSFRRSVRTTNYEIIVVGDAKLLADIAFYIDRLNKIGIDITTIELPGDSNDCAYNVGAKHAKGDYLLFMDCDTELTKGSFEQLIGACTRRDVIAAGPRFLADDVFIDNVGISLSDKGIVKNGQGLNKTDGSSLDRFLCSMDVEAISGKCMAIRKDILERFDGFDNNFSNLYKGIDLSIRCQDKMPGHNIVADPTVEVKVRDHDNALTEKNDSLLIAKWDYIKDINYCSYNLNLDMYKSYDVIKRDEPKEHNSKRKKKYGKN